MGELEATILKLGDGEEANFLIMLIGDTVSEEEEAKVLSDAINKVREKMNILYFNRQKFIPLRYSSDITPRLRSLLITC